MKALSAAAFLLLIVSLDGRAVASVSTGPNISSAARTGAKPVARKVPVPQNRKSKGGGPHARATQNPQQVPFRWRPADPSFDQQGRPYRPPPGMTCPIDLGYGRWTSCNDDL